jgi:peptidoglycan/xylan/chitin deacetylase (PgdA/CDA1 family)
MFDDGIEPREAMCDWDDLLELMTNGVSVQSHGVSHRRFSEISLEEQKDELMRSKSILENNLGSPVEFMAFPYGDDGKNKEHTKSCLRETGYQAACLYGGDSFVLPPANPYCLSRIAMGPDTNLEEVLGVRQPR